MPTEPTECLSEAVEFVRENLLRETFETRLRDESRVEIDHLEDYEAIPVRIEGGCDFDGFWQLVAVGVGKVSSLSATYQFHKVPHASN